MEPINPNLRDQIEPGVMGNTNPEEQKILENLSHIAAGYALGKMGGAAAESLFGKMSSMLSEAGGSEDALSTLHKMADLTPEESATVKNIPLSQQKEPFAQELRSKWVNVARETQTPDSIEDIKTQARYLNPYAVKSIGLGTAAAGAGLQKPFNTPDMQSLRDKLKNNANAQ